MTKTDRPYFIPIGTSGAGLVDYDALLREQFQESQEDRHAMLCEAAFSFLNGDIGDTRAALRILINATCGFPALAKETGIPPKSLMRMLSESGNPTSSNLAKVIQALARQEGVSFGVTMEPPIPAWVEEEGGEETEVAEVAAQ